MLTYYLPILPLWSGIILGLKRISVGSNYAHCSNAVVENWMRIVKLNILGSETNLRPGDLIKKLYPGIVSRIRAFRFAFHPRANKVFKGHKRLRDNSEEQSIEEWSRRSKQTCGYLKPKIYEFPITKKIKVDNKAHKIKDKFVPRKYENYLPYIT